MKTELLLLNVLVIIKVILPLPQVEPVNDISVPVTNFEEKIPNENIKLSTLSKTNQHRSTNGSLPIFEFNVAIVCDLECLQLFENSKEKLVNFLLLAFGDVNLVFKTLQLTNVTFRITSVTAIKSRAEQAFVEQTRSKRGTTNLQEMHTNFSKWIFHQIGILPKFDIAILMTGDSKESYGVVADESSICTSNFGTNTFGAIITIRPVRKGFAECSALTQSLALVLGMPYNKFGSAFHTCRDRYYTESNICETKRRFYLSKCTDQLINKVLLSDKAFCLRHKSIPELSPLSSTHAAFDDFPVKPLTVTEQCQLFSNNPKAFAKKDGSNCIRARCFEMKYNRVTFVATIYPLTGTPCGLANYCFRGRCIKKGYQIRNVATKMCLLGSNRFSSEDFAVHTKCPEHSTAMEKFMLFDRGALGTFLAIPFSTPEGDENDDKCVGVNQKGTKLQFYPCSEENPVWLGWDLILAEGYEDEFILFHKHIKKCAKSGRYSQLELSYNCNSDDPVNRWTFGKSDFASKQFVKLVRKHKLTTHSTTEYMTTNFIDLKRDVENNELKGPVLNDSKEQYVLTVVSALLTCSLLVVIGLTVAIVYIIRFKNPVTKQ